MYTIDKSVGKTFQEKNKTKTQLVMGTGHEATKFAPRRFAPELLAIHDTPYLGGFIRAIAFEAFIKVDSSELKTIEDACKLAREHYEKIGARLSDSFECQVFGYRYHHKFDAYDVISPEGVVTQHIENGTTYFEAKGRPCWQAQLR